MLPPQNNFKLGTVGGGDSEVLIHNDGKTIVPTNMNIGKILDLVIESYLYLDTYLL